MPVWDEADRLAALDRYAILDTPREAEFDDVVRLAADVFGAAISFVNLIADGRQWFKAEVGIGADELKRTRSYRFDGRVGLFASGSLPQISEPDPQRAAGRRVPTDARPGSGS